MCAAKEDNVPTLECAGKHGRVHDLPLPPRVQGVEEGQIDSGVHDTKEAEEMGVLHWTREGDKGLEVPFQLEATPVDGLVGRGLWPSGRQRGQRASGQAVQVVVLSGPEPLVEHRKVGEALAKLPFEISMADLEAVGHEALAIRIREFPACENKASIKSGLKFGCVFIHRHSTKHQSVRPHV